MMSTGAGTGIGVPRKTLGARRRKSEVAPSFCPSSPSDAAAAASSSLFLGRPPDAASPPPPPVVTSYKKPNNEKTPLIASGITPLRCVSSTPVAAFVPVATYTPPYTHAQPIKLFPSVVGLNQVYDSIPPRHILGFSPPTPIVPVRMSISAMAVTSAPPPLPLSQAESNLIAAIHATTRNDHQTQNDTDANEGTEEKESTKKKKKPTSASKSTKTLKASSSGTKKEKDSSSNKKRSTKKTALDASPDLTSPLSSSPSFLSPITPHVSSSSSSPPTLIPVLIRSTSLQEDSITPTTKRTGVSHTPVDTNGLTSMAHDKMNHQQLPRVRSLQDDSPLTPPPTPPPTTTTIDQLQPNSNVSISVKLTPAAQSDLLVSNPIDLTMDDSHVSPSVSPSPPRRKRGRPPKLKLEKVDTDVKRTPKEQRTSSQASNGKHKNDHTKSTKPAKMSPPQSGKRPVGRPRKSHTSTTHTVYRSPPSSPSDDDYDDDDESSAYDEFSYESLEGFESFSVKNGTRSRPARGNSNTSISVTMTPPDDDSKRSTPVVKTKESTTTKSTSNKKANTKAASQTTTTTKATIETKSSTDRSNKTETAKKAPASSSSSSISLIDQLESNIRRSSLRERKSQPRYEEEEVLDPYAFVEPWFYSREINQPFKCMIDPIVPIILDIHSHLVHTEVIGLLGGLWEESTKVLRILSAHPCRTLQTGNDHVNVELDPVAQIEAAEKISQSKQITVGWYHSHPVFRNDPSVIDVNNQMSYQFLFRSDDSRTSSSSSCSSKHGISTPASSSSSSSPFIAAIITPFGKDDFRPLPSSIKWFATISPREKKKQDKYIVGGSKHRSKQDATTEKDHAYKPNADARQMSNGDTKMKKTSPSSFAYVDDDKLDIPMELWTNVKRSIPTTSTMTTTKPINNKMNKKSNKNNSVITTPSSSGTSEEYLTPPVNSILPMIDALLDEYSTSTHRVNFRHSWQPDDDGEISPTDDEDEDDDESDDAYSSSSESVTSTQETPPSPPAKKRRIDKKTKQDNKNDSGKSRRSTTKTKTTMDRMLPSAYISNKLDQFRHSLSGHLLALQTKKMNTTTTSLSSSTILSPYYRSLTSDHAEFVRHVIRRVADWKNEGDEDEEEEEEEGSEEEEDDEEDEDESASPPPPPPRRPTASSKSHRLSPYPGNSVATLTNHTKRSTTTKQVKVSQTSKRSSSTPPPPPPPPSATATTKQNQHVDVDATSDEAMDLSPTF